MDVCGNDAYSCSCVHMHIQRHMCVYACAWGRLMMSAVSPNSSQPYIVRKGLTIDLGLRWLTGLASQWTAKIYLFLQPTPALGLQMNASSVNVVLEIWTQVLILAWWELYQLSQSQPPVLLLSATIFIQTGLTQFGISLFLGEARIPYRNLSAPVRSSIPGFLL